MRPKISITSVLLVLVLIAAGLSVSQDSASTAELENDVVWQRLQEFNANKPEEHKRDFDKDDVWYFQNPVREAGKYSLPTQNGFKSSMQIADYGEADRNRREKWDAFSSKVSPEARATADFIRHINDTMLGCGQDYFGSIQALANRDLLPFELSSEDIETAQDFFENHAYHSIPVAIWSHGKACRQVYPGTPPSPKEAASFTRLVTFGQMSRKSPDFLYWTIADRESPWIESAEVVEFNRDLESQQFSNRLERVDWLREWLLQHEYRINREFFDKVRDFLREHLDAVSSG